MLISASGKARAYPLRLSSFESRCGMNGLYELHILTRSECANCDHWADGPSIELPLPLLHRCRASLRSAVMSARARARS